MDADLEFDMVGYIREEWMKLVKRYKDWTFLDRYVEEPLVRKMAVFLTRAR